MSGIFFAIDTTGMDELEALLPIRNLKVTVQTGDDIVADVKAHWSGYYPPSGPAGQPPAVRSGELDASVMAGIQDANDMRAIVRVVAASAHAAYQEYGTAHAAARPFLRPAVMRAEGTFGRRFAVLFEGYS